MKRSLLNTMLLLLLSGTTYAQSFTLLANDPSGDKKPGSGTGAADVKSISYSLDAVNDSLWIRLETHNPVTTANDFGLMLGIDTNHVTTDGTNWPGANTSMKYDHALFVWMNLIQPGAYYIYRGHPGSANMVTGTVKRPDNYTFIINTRLSLADQDGKFNLLGFSSTFDVAFTSTPIVIDDIPNAGGGYLTVPFSCAAPPSVSVSNITHQSATYSWTAVSGAAGYEAATTQSPTPPASGFALTGTGVNVTQLAPNTTYYAHVRSQCGASFSPLWQTQTFTTKPVSVGEIAGILQGVQAYPNPSEGHFTVELPEGLKNAEVRILDVMGRRIIEQRKLEENSKVSFDLSNKAKGLYILQVESSRGVHRTRLSIQ